MGIRFEALDESVITALTLVSLQISCEEILSFSLFYFFFPSSLTPNSSEKEFHRKKVSSVVIRIR